MATKEAAVCSTKERIHLNIEEEEVNKRTGNNTIHGTKPTTKDKKTKGRSEVNKYTCQQTKRENKSIQTDEKEIYSNGKKINQETKCIKTNETMCSKPNGKDHFTLQWINDQVNDLKQLLLNSLNMYCNANVCEIYRLVYDNNEVNTVKLFLKQKLLMSIPQRNIRDYKNLFNIFAHFVDTMFDNNNKQIVYKNTLNGLLSFPRFVIMRRYYTIKNMIGTRSKVVYYEPYNLFSLNDCLLIAIKNTFENVSSLRFKSDKFCKFFTHNRYKEHTTNSELCLILCHVVSFKKGTVECKITVDITL